MERAYWPGVGNRPSCCAATMLSNSPQCSRTVSISAAKLGGGMRVTVFVPTTAPRSKVEKLRSFPVEVREAGATYNDAHREAQAFATETGAVMGDPLENPLIAAGHGTLGAELLEQRPDLSAVIVPVGGGALITGVATAIKVQAPHVRVIAVQAEASPALVESQKLGRALIDYTAAPTLADGLAGGIGELVYRHRHLIDELITVSEDEIAAAMVALLARDQVVAEGAGAVGVAAILARKLRLDGPTAALVTGANVDVAVLARLLAHHA